VQARAGYLNSPVKLFALDVRREALAAGRRARALTSVNVAVAPGPRPSSVKSASLRRILGIRGPIERRRLPLVAGEALELRYRLRPGRAIGASVVTQYLFWRRGTQYVVTFGTSAGESESYAALFRQSAETFRFLTPRQKTRPAADPAEDRWIREANALCRRVRRDLERLPRPRTPRELEDAFETFARLNKRYNSEFLALPAPQAFARELGKLRAGFARDERLFAKLVVAVRARDKVHMADLMGRLTVASEKESAIMGKLGAEDCDVYGYGDAS
jgi:hypothetical protein